MEKKDIQKIFVAVPMQENMMFSWMNDKQNSAYVEQMIIEIKGEVDEKRIEDSFQILFDNYDSLRSNFVSEGVSKTRQVVLKHKKAEVEYYDLSEESNVDGKIKDLIDADREKGFNLMKSCLMRMSVIKYSLDKYTLIWTNHHIILDGWSRSILVKEFYKIYACLGKGVTYHSQNLDNFAEYARWIKKQNMDEGLSFWKNYLDGYSQSVGLRTVTNRTVEKYDPQEEVICIDQERYNKIREITKKNNITVNAFFQSIWGILLQKYNDQNDVVFGMVVSGRNSEFEQIDSTVGVLINSVPVRICSNDDDTFIDLVVRVQREINELMQYSYVPLTEIQNSMSEVKGLVNHLTAFENYPEIEKGDASTGFEIVNIRANEQINYDFGITFVPGDTVTIRIRYDNNAFEPGEIKRLSCHLENLIQNVINYPEMLISKIDYLSEEEKNELIDIGKGKCSSDSEQLTLFGLYEDSVKKYRDKTALSYIYYFKDIVESLGENSLSKIEEERIKKACFQKSKYIYKYSSINLIVDKIDPSYVDDVLLFRSKTHKLVALTQITYDLLCHINCEYSIGDIYTAVQENNLSLDAWKIESNTSGQFLLNHVEVKGDFYGFIKLIYLLTETGLLDYDKFQIQKKKFEYKYKKTSLDNTVMNNITGTVVPLYKPDCRVLLLGDTPGSATTGLLYIASYLRRHGIEAYCNWNSNDRINENLKENIIKMLDEVKPTIVGISMKWFIHIYRVLEMARIVKEYSSDIKVVLGGNTASYYSDKVIFEENIDIIIKGDGELPFLRICENADYLPNCTYVKNGELIKNEITYVQTKDNSKDVYLSDLDKIFVYKDDVYKAAYFFLYTGKGCSMNCCYCAGCRESQEKTFNRSIPFMRDIENVRQDIKAIIPYTGVFMYDFDLPNYDSLDYYNKLWDGIDLTNHFCMFYFWKLPSEEFLQMVSKRYKYVYINIDIASLSERHRNQLTKLHVVKPQPSDQEIIQCFESCSKYDNIEITINQIAGLPYFNEYDVQASEQMVQYLSSQFPCFRGIDWGRLHAQPGAKLAMDADKYDMHSSAGTYEEFLKYSKMNVTEMEIYPDLSNTFYPFIEYDDDSKNKMISKHYVKINEILERYTVRDNRYPMKYHLTYGELDRRVEALAGYLKANGIGHGDKVALLIERSMEQVIGILGVMKVGAAYVPIDTAYPAQRKKYILDDSNAKAVLCLNESKFDIDFGGKVLSMNGILKDCPSDVEFAQVLPSDLAYIIYTSGTTGNPKGVMICQNTVARTIKWRANEYQLNDNDVILQLFSYAFDGFLTSMFTPLASGSEAFVIHDDEINDPVVLRNYIRENKVTHFISVPQLFFAILDAMDEEDATSLRIVTLAGDKVSKKLIQLTKRVNRNLELVNEYGPTECSVVATIARNMDQADRVTIGKPVDDTEVYILDKCLNLLPRNSIGEICIGGSRLALGYVNNESLTKEKFVDNPYTGYGKLYHTGDVGRWNEEGNIEFIERNDSQVKIRGYRIEIGEIEQCLAEIEGIEQAVVKCFTQETGDKYLCAYIVPTSNFNISELELENILSKRLASYMIPKRIVSISEIPMNQNGKIDYTMLESPSLTQDNSEKPVTEQEKAVAEIWEEVLGISNIGVTDSFFALGGDSIKVMQIISRLQKINIKVKMKEIFKYPTIRSLLYYVEKQNNNAKIEQTTMNHSEEYGLTPIQSWFYEQNFKNRNYWNQSIMIFREEGFSLNICNKCLSDLISGNSALRTKFLKKDSKYIQQILDAKDIDTKVIVSDLRNCDNLALEIEKEAEDLQKSLDISKGIVIKAIIFKTNQGDHLLFTLHHLVVDGVSLRVLLEKFYIGYKRYVDNEDSSNEYAKEQFTYKEWQQILLQRTEDWAPKYFDYWEDTVNNAETVFNISENYDSTYSNYGFIENELDENITQDLLKSSNTVYHTETNDLLISALAMTINQVYGVNKCVINLEGHGRNEAFVGKTGLLENIGWYTCSYPFLLHSGCDELGKLIKTTKESIRKVRDINLSYGMLRYMGDEKYAQIKYEPQIGFNYLGQIDHEVKNDLFGLSNYSFGSPVDIESTRPYVFDFSLKIVSGRLQIKLNYNKLQIDSDEAKKLFEQYCKCLERIVEYCNGKEEQEVTQSDLGDMTLSDDELQEIMNITEGKARKVYPLSHTQEGMIFHNLLEQQNTSTYFQQVSFDLCGKVDPSLVKTALEAICNKHDALRTKVIYKGLQSTKQVVVTEPCVDYCEIDMTHLPIDQQNDWLDSYLEDDRNKGFVIDGGNLTRISLICFDHDEYRIVWSFHHLLMDGWCIGLLIKDFFNMYKMIANGRGVVYDSAIQYSDYIKWISDLETDTMKTFWKDYLSGCNTKNGVIPNKENSDYSLAIKTVHFSEDDTTKLRDLAKENHATLNSMLELIWAVTMGIVNDKTEYVFGSVYSGRNMELEGIENVVGLHINTVPVRISYTKDERIGEILKRIQAESIELEENQYLSLADIAKAASLENPLYDNIIAFENYPIEKMSKDDHSDQLIWIGDKITLFEQTNYDFNITVLPEEDMVVKLKYNQNAFEEKFIEKVITTFEQVFQIVKNNIGSKIKDVENTVLSVSSGEQRYLSEYRVDPKLLSSIYRYVQPMLANEGINSFFQSYQFEVINSAGYRVDDGVVGNLCLEATSFKDNISVCDLRYDYEQTRWVDTGVQVRILEDKSIQVVSMDTEHALIDDEIINLRKLENALDHYGFIKKKKAVAYNDKKESYIVIYLVLCKGAVPSMMKEVTTEYKNAYFVRVDQIPLYITRCDDFVNHGKSGSEYIPPKTEVQKILVEVWEELLNADRIGIMDNFFDLDGDSIKALKLISKLYSRNIKLDMKELFLYPTIKELENKVEWIEEEEEITEEEEDLIDMSKVDAIRAMLED